MEDEDKEEGHREFGLGCDGDIVGTGKSRQTLQIRVILLLLVAIQSSRDIGKGHKDRGTGR